MNSLSAGTGWFVLFFFGMAGWLRAEVDAARTKTNETDSVAVDQVHEATSELIKDSAEKLDLAIDNMFAPDEAKRSATFDRFFGDRRVNLLEQRSRIKLSPSIEFAESGEMDIGFKFRAKLDLPRAEKRIHLIAGNRDEDRDVLETFSESGLKSRALQGEDDTSVALSTRLGSVQKIKFSADAGLKFRPEPVPKFKLRGKYLRQWEDWTLTVSESGIWESDDGFSEKTALDLRWAIDDRTFIRSTSAGIWSENSKGVDLGQAFVWHHELNSSCTLGLEGGIAGHTEPTTDVDRYLIRAPVRQRLYKDWIFLEIEPGADFPADRDYRFSPLILMKLEFVFGDRQDDD